MQKFIIIWFVRFSRFVRLVRFVRYVGISCIIWHVCFFRAAKNLNFPSFCKLPVSTAPRPGGSFGALAADFSKSCVCRTSDLRLLGSPSAGASVVLASRKDYIAEGVFTFFVHWQCLRFLLIFATNLQLIFVFPDFVFFFITTSPFL